MRPERANKVTDKKKFDEAPLWRCKICGRDKVLNKCPIDHGTSNKAMINQDK